MSIQEHTAKVTNTEQQGKSGEGYIKTGLVVATEPITRTCTVNIDGRPVPGCVWAAGIMSSLFGFRTTFVPPIGTTVYVLYYGKEPIIVGCKSSNPDAKSMFSKTATAGVQNLLPIDLKTFSNKEATDGPVPTHAGPADLLEGEFDISNALGVGITMLTHLAKLGAGERAKIEFFLLDDLARIVSENFEHYTAFGDMRVYNDGRLNVVFNGTSYPYEAAGMLSPNSGQDAPFKSGGKNTVSVDESTAIETGRWRFSRFVGFLGDFVNEFITDPTTTLGVFAENAYRSGKLREYRGSDGSYLMQSVTEIAFERVCRIPVPVEIKSPDHEDQMKVEDYADLETKFEKIWDFGPDNKNMAHTAFQIREYARWLSLYHSFARFHQIGAKKGTWKIPSEHDTPAPSWTNGEAGRDAANAGIIKYRDVYSTIRILRDGSQLFMDGYGSAVCMNSGNVYISAAKHLHLESAGDIRVVAGQNIYMKARRNMEFSAIVGGLKLKARTWLHGLCEWGSIWLKSDAQDPNNPDFEEPQPALPSEDPKPVILPFAVFLEASKGQTMVSSKQRLTLQTQGADYNQDDEMGAVVIQAKGSSLAARALKQIDIRSNTAWVSLYGATAFVCKAAKALFQTNIFDIGRRLTFKAGKLSVAYLDTLFIRAKSSIRGPRRPAGQGPHRNHIDEIDNGWQGPAFSTESEVQEKYLAISKSKAPQDGLSDQVLEWKFDKPTEYVNPQDPLFESLTQQRLRTDNTLSDNYLTWTPVQSALKPAPRVKVSSPFGATTHMAHGDSSIEQLGTPSTKASNQHNQQTEMTPIQAEFRFLKRNAV